MSGDTTGVRYGECINTCLSVAVRGGRSQADFVAKHPGVAFVCDEVETVDTTRNLAKLAKGGMFHFSRWGTRLLGSWPTCVLVHNNSSSRRGVEQRQGEVEQRCLAPAIIWLDRPQYTVTKQ